MTILIDRNKHIGILSYPRTGSTILQDFLCQAFHKINLFEMMHLHDIHSFEYKDHLKISLKTEKIYTPEIEFNKRIEILKSLTKDKIFGVFKIFDVYIKEFSGLTKKLISDDIQIIRLERRNKLNALISTYLCRHTKIWRVTSEFENENVKNHLLNNFITVNINLLIRDLNFMIKVNEYKNRKFKNVPIIYFEDFEDNPSNSFNKMFGTNIDFITPSKRHTLNSIQYIKNSEEVLNVYNKFKNSFE